MSDTINALLQLRQCISDVSIITDTISTTHQRKTVAWFETSLTAKPFTMRVTADTLQNTYTVKVINSDDEYVLTQGKRQVKSGSQLIHIVGILRQRAVDLILALEATSPNETEFNGVSRTLRDGIHVEIKKRALSGHAQIGGVPLKSSKPQLRFKKLKANAVIPKYETAGAAGLDLRAVSCEPVERTSVEYLSKVYGHSDLLEFERKHLLLYRTGIAVEIPRGYVGLLVPRSSVATKTDLSLANSVGVIDSDYRGEIMAVFRIHDYNLPRHSEEHGGYAFTEYEAGDRVCQLVVVPCPQFECVEVDELETTARGEGGFGSTGK